VAGIASGIHRGGIACELPVTTPQKGGRAGGLEGGQSGGDLPLGTDVLLRNNDHNVLWN
jgi:hypothetical protein